MTAYRLLVVEDDIFIGMDMVHTLTTSGYEAAHARSLPEAKQMLAAGHFDGAVLDFRVGIEDTLSFAEEMLAAGQRVMFCTGSSPGDVRELVGDVEVVGKPFTEQQLLGAVERMLRKSPLAAA